MFLAGKSYRHHSSAEYKMLTTRNELFLIDGEIAWFVRLQFELKIYFKTRLTCHLVFQVNIVEFANLEDRKGALI